MCHVDPPDPPEKTQAQKQTEAIVCGLFMGIFVAFMVGLFLGNFIGQGAMMKEAIRNDFAMYHPTTGQWMWKVSPPEPPIPPEQLQRPSLEDPSQITVND